MFMPGDERAQAKPDALKTGEGRSVISPAEDEKLLLALRSALLSLLS
jgi:hypothetical protein